MANTMIGHSYRKRSRGACSTIDVRSRVKSIVVTAGISAMSPISASGLLLTVLFKHLASSPASFDGHDYDLNLSDKSFLMVNALDRS